MATTTTERPEKRPTVRATSVDAWMDTETRFLGRDVKRQTLWLWALRLPAFVPVLFMSPAIVTLNSAVMDTVEADVLGTGSMLLLMLTLLITPLSTLTRQRWFIPLRRWYGVMMAITAFTVFLLVFRLPRVKRWVAEKQREGQEWKVYLTVLPLAALFILAFSFM